jgi:hypothetical protein
MGTTGCEHRSEPLDSTKARNLPISLTNENCQINTAHFEKWVDEKFVPNLPPHAVIVPDNAPCHCIQFDKPPSAYIYKSAMTSWLHN